MRSTLPQARPNTPTLVRKDLRMLGLFIRLYCDDHHEHAAPVALQGFNLREITGENLRLCPECTKLLAHAFVKRSHCPMDPKPQCKHCSNHCYAPAYQEKIRTVMQYSGRKMILSGRLDYLVHLLS